MNHKLRCIVVDDEPLAQQVIVTYIGRLSHMELVATCDNAMEAMQALQKDKIDVMFLDIQMPVITGVEFLRSLQHPPRVIFTTAYPDFALDGYDLNITDYLLKPISFERFMKAVNKLSEAVNNEEHNTPIPDHFFVKEDGKLVRVNFADIDHIECMKDYAKIFTKQRMIVTHHTMKKFEEVLPDQQFMRIHRSYIVSLSSINAIFGNVIETAKGRLPVGANYREMLMEKIKVD
ncbi:MAG TPA: response regulator transcription factor [Chitinophagales bacterium]|nr:response regulator transcription factor [Chitinophagales bacterium]HNA57155.1 response regulator transcription factor [Chitinophagales bacterium]HNI54692.1 response regulator transcription factor [Chitinophagales bacterium]HNJ89620.1 response regulator transcription factor [Chitinophagales bacterium]HNK97861.1 response regulator transcription factor [Chitinophagales bacterium]